MEKKRKNPYQMLMDDIKDFCREIKYRHFMTMWRYPKDKLGEKWQLVDLYERTAAAEQLGYDVVLIANEEEGLVVQYIKKVPQTPIQWQ